MTRPIEVWVPGRLVTQPWNVEAYDVAADEWLYEDRFVSRREAQKYVRNCRFWDGIARRIVNRVPVQ